MNSNPGQRSTPASNTSTTGSGANSKRMNPAAPPNVQPPDNDAFRFVGDEMDAWTSRELASTRYKRNHIFLSEILSPIPADSIIQQTPRLWGSKNSSDFAEAQTERKRQLDADMEEMARVHELKLKSIRENSKRIYGGMASVVEAKSLEDVQQLLDDMCSQLELKAVPHAPIVRVHKHRDPNVDVAADDFGDVANVSVDQLMFLA